MKKIQNLLLKKQKNDLLNNIVFPFETILFYSLKNLILFSSYDLKIAKSEYAPTLDLISKMGYKYNYDSPSSSSAAFSRNGYHMYQNSLVLTQNLFKGFGTKYKIEYEEARVMAAAYKNK